MSELKKQDALGGKLCEIEAVAKGYTKKVRRTPRDMGIEKVRNYLKNNQLVAVPFDKVVEICVMKKHTYYETLTKLTESKLLIGR